MYCINRIFCRSIANGGCVKNSWTFFLVLTLELLIGGPLLNSNPFKLGQSYYRHAVSVQLTSKSKNLLLGSMDSILPKNNSSYRQA